MSRVYQTILVCDQTQTR